MEFSISRLQAGWRSTHTYGTIALSNRQMNGVYFPEPRCAVALVSDGRTGPPDLERGSPSCPPPANDNPPTDRGGADSETESDTDDP